MHCKWRLSISKASIRSALSLAMLCLLLAACASKNENAARRGLTPFTPAPGMTVYLPDGWQVGNSAEYGAALDALCAKIPLAMARPDAAFYAARQSADGAPAAILTIGRAKSTGLTNDMLAVLTAEEKQQFAQAMIFTLQNLSTRADLPLAVSRAFFKQTGRYEPLLISGSSQNLITFDSALYFLPDNALALSYMRFTAVHDDIDPAAEFARILAAFEPDAAYKPTPPPARNTGESMPQYLLRVNAKGKQL